MSCLVRINGLAYGGALVGEVIEGGPGQVGKRAFVRFAAPGELVEITVDKEEKRLIEGSILDIREHSASRVAPVCPYFTRCGGCDLQHLTIETQRALKRSMVESTLLRQGGIAAVRGVRLAAEELPALSYRRRATMHLSEAGELGFYMAGSGVVVAIEHCAIATPALNTAFQSMRSFAAALARDCGAVIFEEDHAGAVSVLLVPRPGREAQLEIPAALRTGPLLIGVKGGDRQEVGADEIAGHFSQVNAAGNAALISLVLGYVSHSEVTELYAGAGNFSFALAQRGAQVAAVELDSVLVAAGEKFAQSRGISAVRFTQMSCEKYVRHHPLRCSVVLDPPRSGAREVAQRIKTTDTQEVVYVSCNLPSLVRDLKILSERGYELQETVLVDMFPQTHHVETVSYLTSR